MRYPGKFWQRIMIIKCSIKLQFLHLKHIKYWHRRHMSRKQELGNTPKCKGNLFYDKGTFLIIKESG